MASLIRSILSILSGRVVALTVGVLFTPLLVRVLSQEQYGMYASILAAYSVIALLSKGGIFDASRKIIAEHLDDSDQASSIVTTALFLALIYGLIATTFVYLALQIGLVPNEYTDYLLILLLAILFENVFQVVRGYFHGVKKEHIGETLMISQKILYTSVGLALAFIGYDLYGIFVGYTLSFVFLSAIGLIAVYWDSRFTWPSPETLTEHGGNVASYGGHQLIGGVSAFLIYKTDILLVEYFRGSAETALYNSAIVPAELIWFVPSVIQIAFLQHTANLWSNGKVQAITDDMKTGVKYGILSLTLFGIGLFALSDPFITIYFGPEYTEAAMVLQILLFGTIFMGVSRIISPIFHATGWIRYSNYVTVGGLALNIMANIILIPQYGIIGAGIGTAISYVCIFVGSLLIWWRSPFPLVSSQWAFRIVVTQLVFAGIFIALVRSANLSPLFSLAVFPPIGFFLFLVINLQAGYLSRDVLKGQLRSVIGTDT